MFCLYNVKRLNDYSKKKKSRCIITFGFFVGVMFIREKKYDIRTSR